MARAGRTMFCLLDFLRVGHHARLNPTPYGLTYGLIMALPMAYPMAYLFFLYGLTHFYDLKGVGTSKSF